MGSASAPAAQDAGEDSGDLTLEAIFDLVPSAREDPDFQLEDLLLPEAFRASEPGQPAAPDDPADSAGGEADPRPPRRELLRWRVRDAGNAPFDYLPAEVFRRRPPPPPADPEEDALAQLAADLPRADPRVPRPRALEGESATPLLQARGRRMGVPADQAALEFENQSRRVVLRVSLEPIGPEGGPAGEPVVLLLPPESSESFRLPAGEYRAVREAWPSGDDRAVARDAFAPDNLAPGGSYGFAFTERDERALLPLLARQAAGAPGR